jgi:hypothetical protein
MKKFLAIILVIVLTLSLTACGASPDVESDDIILGKSGLMELGNGLYYDVNTRIVYWWNGNLNGVSSGYVTPSPYYAPNGLPYRYNPQTNTFEEIDIS